MENNMENNNQKKIEFNINPQSWKQIAKLTAEYDGEKNAPEDGYNNQQAALRIEVKGGGCSGFMYHFDITTKYNSSEDYIIYPEENSSKALAVIDKLSFSFLDGSELNHISNLEGEYFEIKNPNATSKCGCGSSFAI